MSNWRRLVLLTVLTVVPLQLWAGGINVLCPPATSDGAASQHVCCPDDVDQEAPHDIAQCEAHCAGCFGSNISSCLAGSAIVAITAGRLFMEHATFFPTGPYFRMLRPPRG